MSTTTVRNVPSKLPLNIPIPQKERTHLFEMVAIGLIAIHSKGKWCSTHETRGWYMPAGRVDYGEGLVTGAKREAKEEAGIEVELEGVVRIDFTPSRDYLRLRVIYKAKQKNEEEKLRDKSQADHEIIEAVYVNPEELIDGRKVRSLEMVAIFEYLNRNPRLGCPDLVDSSIDGHPIEHSIVQTPTVTSASLILTNHNRTKCYFPKPKSSSSSSSSNNDNDAEMEIEGEEKKRSLIHYFMQKTKSGFPPFIKEEFTKETKIRSEALELFGLVKLRFVPPDDRVGREFGSLNAVYWGVIGDEHENILRDHYSVITLEELERSDIHEYDLKMVKDVMSDPLKYVAPMSILDYEHCEYGRSSFQ